MFIATGARTKDFAPLGAKPDGGTFAGTGKSNCAPTELRSKEKTTRAINIPPLGRNDKQCSVALPGSIHIVLFTFYFLLFTFAL
jgi:hypothetical protein